MSIDRNTKEVARFRAAFFRNIARVNCGGGQDGNSSEPLSDYAQITLSGFPT